MPELDLPTLCIRPASPGEAINHHQRSSQEEGVGWEADGHFTAPKGAQWPATGAHMPSSLLPCFHLPWVTPKAMRKQEPSTHWSTPVLQLLVQASTDRSTKGRVTGCYSFRPGQKCPTEELRAWEGRKTEAKGHGELSHLTSRRGDRHCWWLGDKGDACIPILMDPDVPPALLLPP